MEHKRSQWVSNIGSILAATGSAVGLGNIRKFPGKVVARGGGTFLVCYALVILPVGFPVMLAELSIGRSTQKNMMGAFHRLNPRWNFTGGIGVLTLSVIMSYYSVIGGWAMKYISVHLIGTDLSAFGNDSSGFSAHFADFISRPTEPLFWDAAPFLLCIYVVVRGVPGGIGWVSKSLIPSLSVLLIRIVVYAMTLDGVAEGPKYTLAVDPAKLNGGTAVAALGQAFFFFSVGVSIMAIYGSYVSRTENLAKSAGCIRILGSLVALLSGLAIAPVVYIMAGPEAMGMGGGFAFMALPEVFSRLPSGVFFGFAFLPLLFVAALTSATSTLESCIAWFTEEFGSARSKATLLLVVPISFLSAGYSLFQGATDIKLPWFDFINDIQYLPMNAVMEKFTDNLMTPLGALCFCLFVGWVWGTDDVSKETEASGYSTAWKRPQALLVKFLVPVVTIVILYFTTDHGQGLS